MFGAVLAILRPQNYNTIPHVKSYKYPDNGELP